MIKVVIEISTDWIDPEYYDNQTALDNLKTEIKDSIAKGLGIRYQEINVTKIEVRMIQVVKYKCCGSIFAACVEPDCYTEKDWTKNLKEYAKQGHKIEMVESFKFGECKCKKQEIKLPSLFD